mgnify:CR=1 FL=1
MIHEEICTYEVCKLAKEKGFNCKVYNYYQATKHYCETLRGIELHSVCWRLETDDCYNRYNKSSEDVVSAPTQSLLQRWLREEKGIIIEVFMDDDSNMPLTYNIHQYKDWNWECVCHHHGNYYAVTNWELCLEDALKYALENLV